MYSRHAVHTTKPGNTRLQKSKIGKYLQDLPDNYRDCKEINAMDLLPTALLNTMLSLFSEFLFLTLSCVKMEYTPVHTIPSLTDLHWSLAQLDSWKH